MNASCVRCNTDHVLFICFYVLYSELAPSNQINGKWNLVIFQGTVMWISRPLVLFQCRHEEIHWSSLWLPAASSVAFTQRHWLHAVGSREMLPLCDGLPPAFSCAFTPQDTVLRLLAWPNIPSCSRLYWSCLGYHRTSRGWVLSQNKHCSDMGEWRKMDPLTADKEGSGAFCKAMSSLNEESLEVLSGEPVPLCMEKQYRGWASSWAWLVWCHGTYVEEVNTTDENTSQHTQVTAEGWQTRMHTSGQLWFLSHSFSWAKWKNTLKLRYCQTFPQKVPDFFSNERLP